MYQVIKRDGHAAEFNISRISSAIMKAFDATGIPYNSDVIDLLSLQVTADYAGKIRDDRIGVETIQDSVEAVLQRAGYAEVAKAYILYRLTLEMGDIPCSQAGKGMTEGIMKVKYDPQEQVFATVLAYLQTAADNFSQSSANFAGDIFFGGDPSKWLKATNALRLKVLMSLSEHTDNTTLNIKAAFADIVRDGRLMESNADNLALAYVDKPNSYHPLYSTNDKFVVNTMMSSFVIDKLKALNDYRLFYYAAPYENAATDGYTADQMEAYRGVDVTLDFTGINTAYNSRDYSLLNKRYVSQKASEPLVLIGYAEQCLLIAEAIERGWVSGTSQTYYENGVKAALAFVMGLDASTVGKAVTQPTSTAISRAKRPTRAPPPTGCTRSGIRST